MEVATVNVHSKWMARVVALLAVLALVAAACGNDDDDATTATDDEATAEETAEEAGTEEEATEEADAEEEAAGEPLGTVRTQFSWVPDVEWSAWYLADANGHFADRGVEIEMLHGGPNTPAVTQVLAAGDADLGVAADALEIVTAINSGEDYVALGAMYQRAPFGYTWLASTDISGPEDLVGKRIGGVQGDQIQIDAIFELNGLPVDYEFVPMSFDPQPLVDGEMDVITSYVTNQPVQLELQGIETEAAPFSDFGLSSYGDIIFASREFIDNNRDLVVAYLAALLQGVADNRADPMAVIPLLVNDYGADAEIDEAYSEAGNPAYISLMDSDFTDANGLLTMDPARLEAEVFPALETAGETSLPTIEEFFDGSLLAEAHASL